MALISLKQLLHEAQERDSAIPAFNVNNLEQVLAILEAADYVNAPVIIQASLGARKYAGMVFLKGLLQAALEQYPHIPICLHQDHGHEPSVCYEAMSAGFSSVMMDGSLEKDGKTPASIESNILRTKKVVEVAHSLGVSVEGEIGCLGSLETLHAGDEDGSGAQGELSHDLLLTDPQQAKDFVFQTGVDALAIAVGTSHGAVKFLKKPTEETFALYRIQQIHELIPNTPLVLHGSSSVPLSLLEKINAFGGELPYSYGVPLELLQKSIRYGVRKVNIDTDLRLAATAAIREYFVQHPKDFDPRLYLSASKKSMKSVCIERFEALRSSGWGDRIRVQPLSEIKKSYQK